MWKVTSRYVFRQRLAQPTTTTRCLSLTRLSTFRNKSSSTSNAFQETERSKERPYHRSQIPFRRADRGTFFQERPTVGNIYREDAVLQSFLRRMLPDSVFHEISPDLEQFGARVGSEIHELGLECERNLPQHKPFDAWGNRVDELLTSEAWKKQKCIAAEEGIVAIPYENKHGPWSRVHQVAKNMLYSSSSGLYSCPLAMTDGAMQFFRGSPMTASNPIFANAFSRLMSRDPSQFWTSGQWMTERRGGSDVADGTETLAFRQADGRYKLHGYKWFSSATDSDVTLTLARIVDPDGNYGQGTKGISMFFVEVRKPDGSLNGIEIQTLKNKLGTRQVPTAELLLDGADATLVMATFRRLDLASPRAKVAAANSVVKLTAFQADCIMISL